MTVIVVQFSHEATANSLVAGIPAAARAVHQVALAARQHPGIEGCAVCVAGGWVPSAWCAAEFARLAPDCAVHTSSSDIDRAAGSTLHIRGEALLPASEILDLVAHSDTSATGTSPERPIEGDALKAALGALRRQGDAIIAATAKPSDGIVSRHLNRPVSRAISRMVLQVPGVKPVHATAMAAVLGLAMALCLFAGGQNGLVAGAILFQLASIVDGVDGEIARATFRSTPEGAMLDSITDAATNLLFFAGVIFNLWLGGQDFPAMAGAAGLVLLTTGLFVLGRQAKVSGQPLTFDAVKVHFSARPSRWKQWLTWLTMRDFYAAAAALCVIAGFASQLMIVFAVVTIGWFVVSMRVLARPA
jgi:phosphatidylglycerophosphate synthase